MDLASNTSTTQLSPITDPVQQWNTDHVGRIHKGPFKITVGLFAGIAILLCFARIIARLKLMHRLYLDDVFVLIAGCFLIAATVVIYQFVDVIYTIAAVNLDPTVDPTTPTMIPCGAFSKWGYIFLALVWSAVYSIKMSFVIFFRMLIRNVSKKLTLYWKVVCATVIIVWAFCVAEPFILCPYFGDEMIKCFPNAPLQLYRDLATLLTVLDIITDIMLVSIPIIVLRKAQLQWSQKLGIAVFLCLSLFMAVIAAIRITGWFSKSTRSSGDQGIDWSFYWQTMEGNVAVIMGSIAAFRAIFATQLAQRQSMAALSQRGSPSRTWLPSWRMTRPTRRTSDAEGGLRVASTQAPQVPEASLMHATMTGLRTFVRKVDRRMETGPKDEAVDGHPLQSLSELQKPLQIHTTLEFSISSTTVPESSSNTGSSINARNYNLPASSQKDTGWNAV